MDRGSRRQGIALLVITLGSMLLIVAGSLLGFGAPGGTPADPATPAASHAAPAPTTPDATP